MKSLLLVSWTRYSIDYAEFQSGFIFHSESASVEPGQNNFKKGRFLTEKCFPKIVRVFELLV